MLTGDNGILTRAGEAKNRSDEAQIKERIQLAYHSALISGQGSYTKENLEDELEKEFGDDFEEVDDSNDENWKLKVKGQSVIIPAGFRKKSNSQRANIKPAPSGLTYNIGEEVTFGEEKFFVLSDDGVKVKLLAKYCLSKTENIQLSKNATPDDYGRSFSSTNYWSGDITSGPSELQGTYLENHPLPLDETETHNAIKKAQSYGVTKGAFGRLMTYEEAYTIQNGTDNNMKNILWGSWTDGTQPNSGFLLQWIGAVANASEVFVISGAAKGLSVSACDNPYDGVRPVLEIQ